jgi:hypothetical protein
MKRKLLFTFAAISLLLGCATSFAQDQRSREVTRTYTQADFVKVEGGSLNDRIERAVKQFKAANQGDSVWLAYHFPARAGTSYGPFAGMIYYDDGIRLERKDDPVSAAIFLLADASGTQTKITKVRTLDLREPYVFENRPVYWLGDVDAGQSITQLETTLRAQADNKELARGALRAIAVHDSPRVVSLLKEAATKETNIDVQRSAVSNLARVKTSESLAALIELYDGVSDTNVKDEIIAGLARSDERRATDKLLAIAKNDPDPKMRQRAVRRLSAQRGTGVWVN